VKAVLECPSLSLTTFAFSPAAKSSVAQEWRRSYKGMSGSSALSSSGLKCRLSRFRIKIGVPELVANTRSLF